MNKIKLAILGHLLAHTKKINKEYNKQIWSKNLSMGDLVWKAIIPINKCGRLYYQLIKIQNLANDS